MLFDRVVSILVGQEGKKGREITDLRIAFSIQKGSTQSPNKCSARVWNANAETRALIEAIGAVLILKAGYKEDVGAVTIFSGDVIRATTVREGPDWITEIELQDGLVEFRDAKCTVSFGPGVTTEQVIKDLSKRFGLPVRPLPTDVASKQYKAGFAFVGRVRDGLTKACDHMALEWSIQNREIQIIKKGGVLKQRAFLLSPDTGMIGSPAQESKTMTEKAAAKLGFTATSPGVRTEFELNREGEFEKVLMVLGYKVTMLLQPLMEPGGYVQLKSKGINGEFFRVEELTHSGDTHGNEWVTDAILRYLK